MCPGASGEELAVGTESHTPDVTVEMIDGFIQGPRCSLPDLHAVVLSCCREVFAIGAECDAVHPALPSLHGEKSFSSQGVPQHDPFIA